MQHKRVHPAVVYGGYDTFRYRASLFFRASTVILWTIAILLSVISIFYPGNILLRLSASTLALDAIYCWVLKLVASVLFDWPVPRKNLRDHWFASRPLLGVLIAMLGVVISATGPDLYWLVRHPALEWPWRVFGYLSIAICAYPFWLILFYPARWWKQARALKARNHARPAGDEERALVRFWRDMAAVFSAVKRSVAPRRD